MTTQEAITILEDYQTYRRNSYGVGVKVRLRNDHQLHTITRVEEYDYREPYQIDGKFWISPQDIEIPDPRQVGIAIDYAINHLRQQ